MSVSFRADEFDITSWSYYFCGDTFELQNHGSDRQPPGYIRVSLRPRPPNVFKSVTIETFMLDKPEVILDSKDVELGSTCGCDVEAIVRNIPEEAIVRNIPKEAIVRNNPEEATISSRSMCNVRVTFNMSSNPLFTAAWDDILGQNVHGDVCFLVEGRTLLVQSDILKARSIYFGNILSRPFAEGEKEPREIEISDFKYHTIRALVLYLLSDNVGVKYVSKDEDLMDLYRASNKYQLDDLKDKLYELVLYNVDVDNAVDVLIKYKAIRYSELADEIIRFMSENLEHVRTSDGYKDVIASGQLEWLNRVVGLAANWGI